MLTTIPPKVPEAKMLNPRPPKPLFYLLLICFKYHKTASESVGTAEMGVLHQLGYCISWGIASAGILRQLGYCIS
jgi:hypothetical protein